MNNVTSGVGKLLSFVNTVKRLADIRDQVWLYLKQVSLNFEEDYSWDCLSFHLLVSIQDNGLSFLVNDHEVYDTSIKNRNWEFIKMVTL